MERKAMERKARRSRRAWALLVPPDEQDERSAWTKRLVAKPGGCR
jgi:hypothetical protein